MEHSITFGDKNTWADWRLIPKTVPVVSPPEIKTATVEVPGLDGELDLTMALAGRPLFKNRTGTFSFYVTNGFKERMALQDEIQASLAGKWMRMVLEDDPTHYYEGRFSADGWQPGAQWSEISISYEVLPYKRDLLNPQDAWLWDTFNFTTDVIRHYRDLPVAGTLLVDVIGTGMAVVPTIVTTEAGMTVAKGNETYSLAKGVNVPLNIVIDAGSNVLTFAGNGKVSIEFDGGSL